MSGPAQTNGPSGSGKYIDGIDPEDPAYIKNLQRPAEVKEDIHQMENRSRVKVVLNSEVFKEELEQIVDEQLRSGPYPANLIALQQQISELLGPQAARSGLSNVSRASNVIPINDLRGSEHIGFAKGEKLLRCKLAALYRLVDLCGWSHGIYNHISARVSSDEEHFLLNPFGMMYPEITASSLIKVDVNGEVVDQGSSHLGVSKAGFTLHSAIHQARPDIKCIVHLHTSAAVAVSAMKCGFLPISQEAMLCGNISYHEYQGILVNSEEREKLARNLGVHNKVMVLHNHGIVACGETIEEAFHYTFNVMAACEAQIKAVPFGLDNLHMPSEEVRQQAFKTASQGGGGVESTGKKWRVGELEFEALMRALDNSGYRTGYMYRMPLIKQEKKDRTNSEVEIPPASSSFTYVFDGDFEHSKYVSPLKAAQERQKKAFKAGWLTSPNAYKKTELEEIGTTTPKKITKWVPEEDSPNKPGCVQVKLDHPNQFAPQGANPKELKEKQKSIKKNYYEEKVSAGPQSKILEGISWDEAQKAKDGQLSGAGDQVIVVGAASKGIILRDHQHNAVVYRQYYAANPFENMTEAEIGNYQEEVEKTEAQPEVAAEVPSEVEDSNKLQEAEEAKKAQESEGHQAAILAQLADTVVQTVMREALAVVQRRGGKGQQTLGGSFRNPSPQGTISPLSQGGQMAVNSEGSHHRDDINDRVRDIGMSFQEKSDKDTLSTGRVYDRENVVCERPFDTNTEYLPFSSVGQNKTVSDKASSLQSHNVTPDFATNLTGRSPNSVRERYVREDGAASGEYVTVHIDPITVQHNAHAEGMKIKFSIQSTVRRRISAEIDRGSSIEEIFAAASAPTVHVYQSSQTEEESCELLQSGRREGNSTSTQLQQMMVENVEEAKVSVTNLEVMKTDEMTDSNAVEKTEREGGTIWKLKEKDKGKGEEKRGVTLPYDALAAKANVDMVEKQVRKQENVLNNTEAIIDNRLSDVDERKNIKPQVKKNVQTKTGKPSKPDTKSLTLPIHFNTKCRPSVVRSSKMKHIHSSIPPLSPVREIAYEGTEEEMNEMEEILEATDDSFERLLITAEDVLLLCDIDRKDELNLNDFKGIVPSSEKVKSQKSNSTDSFPKNQKDHKHRVGSSEPVSDGNQGIRTEQKYSLPSVENFSPVQSKSLMEMADAQLLESKIKKTEPKLQEGSFVVPGSQSRGGDNKAGKIIGTNLDDIPYADEDLPFFDDDTSSFDNKVEEDIEKLKMNAENTIPRDKNEIVHADFTFDKKETRVDNIVLSKGEKASVNDAIPHREKETNVDNIIPHEKKEISIDGITYYKNETCVDDIFEDKEETIVDGSILQNKKESSVDDIIPQKKKETDKKETSLENIIPHKKRETTGHKINLYKKENSGTDDIIPHKKKETIIDPIIPYNEREIDINDLQQKKKETNINDILNEKKETNINDILNEKKETSVDNVSHKKNETHKDLILYEDLETFERNENTGDNFPSDNETDFSSDEIPIPSTETNVDDIPYEQIEINVSNSTPVKTETLIDGIPFEKGETNVNDIPCKKTEISVEDIPYEFENIPASYEKTETNVDEIPYDVENDIPNEQNEMKADDFTYEIEAIPYETIETSVDYFPYKCTVTNVDDISYDNDTRSDAIPYMNTETSVDDILYNNTETNVDDICYENNEINVDDLPYKNAETDADRYFDVIPYKGMETNVDDILYSRPANIEDNIAANANPIMFDRNENLTNNEIPGGRGGKNSLFDAICEEGPIQTSSPKLARVRQNQNLYSSFSGDFCKSENTLLDSIEEDQNPSRLNAKSQPLLIETTTSSFKDDSFLIRSVSYDHDVETSKQPHRDQCFEERSGRSLQSIPPSPTIHSSRSVLDEYHLRKHNELMELPSAKSFLTSPAKTQFHGSSSDVMPPLPDTLDVPSISDIEDSDLPITSNKRRKRYTPASGGTQTVSSSLPVRSSLNTPKAAQPKGKWVPKSKRAPHSGHEYNPTSGVAERVSSTVPVVVEMIAHGSHEHPIEKSGQNVGTDSKRNNDETSDWNKENISSDGGKRDALRIEEKRIERGWKDDGIGMKEGSKSLIEHKKSRTNERKVRNIEDKETQGQREDYDISDGDEDQRCRDMDRDRKFSQKDDVEREREGRRGSLSREGREGKKGRDKDKRVEVKDSEKGRRGKNERRKERSSDQDEREQYDRLKWEKERRNKGTNDKERDSRKEAAGERSRDRDDCERGRKSIDRDDAERNRGRYDKERERRNRDKDEKKDSKERHRNRDYDLREDNRSEGRYDRDKGSSRDHDKTKDDKRRRERDTDTDRNDGDSDIREDRSRDRYSRGKREKSKNNEKERKIVDKRQDENILGKKDDSGEKTRSWKPKNKYDTAGKQVEGKGDVEYLGNIEEKVRKTRVKGDKDINNNNDYYKERRRSSSEKMRRTGRVLDQYTPPADEKNHHDSKQEVKASIPGARPEQSEERKVNHVSNDLLSAAREDLEVSASSRLSRRRGGAIAPPDEEKWKKKNSPYKTKKDYLSVPLSGKKDLNKSNASIHKSTASLASSTLSRRSKSSSRMFENCPEFVPPREQMNPLTGEPYNFYHPLMSKSTESLLSRASSRRLNRSLDLDRLGAEESVAEPFSRTENIRPSRDVETLGTKSSINKSYEEDEKQKPWLISGKDKSRSERDKFDNPSKDFTKNSRDTERKSPTTKIKADEIVEKSLISPIEAVALPSFGNLLEPDTEKDHVETLAEPPPKKGLLGRLSCVGGRSSAIDKKKSEPKDKEPLEKRLTVDDSESQKEYFSAEKKRMKKLTKGKDTQQAAMYFHREDSNSDQDDDLLTSKPKELEHKKGQRGTEKETFKPSSAFSTFTTPTKNSEGYEDYFEEPEKKISGKNLVKDFGKSPSSNKRKSSYGKSYAIDNSDSDDELNYTRKTRNSDKDDEKKELREERKDSLSDKKWQPRARRDPTSTLKPRVSKSPEIIKPPAVMTQDGMVDQPDYRDAALVDTFNTTADSDVPILSSSAPAYFSLLESSQSPHNLTEPSFDSSDLVHYKKHVRRTSFDADASFPPGSSPPLKHPDHSPVRRRISQISLGNDLNHSGRSRSSSTSTNPLTYQPWRSKARYRGRSMSISEMVYAAGAPRPHRSHSVGEITYNNSLLGNIGGRRRSRTNSIGDVAITSRMYHRRRSRSHSRASLGDTSFGSVAPGSQRRPSGSWSSSHPELDVVAPAPVPARRSASAYEPSKNSQMIEELGRKNMERTKSEHQPQLKEELGEDKPVSPSKSDTMKSTDSASGGETLEERSSKEGSPTKEHPSSKDKKGKKKKFRIPSFSKKKNKEAKESAI